MRDAGASLHHGGGSERGNLTIVGSLPMMAAMAQGMLGKRLQYRELVR